MAEQIIEQISFDKFMSEQIIEKISFDKFSVTVYVGDTATLLMAENYANKLLPLIYAGL